MYSRYKRQKYLPLTIKDLAKLLNRSEAATKQLLYRHKISIKDKNDFLALVKLVYKNLKLGE